MAKVSCIGGHTQISKILAHVKREAQIARVSALVFVGDAMEEKLDDLCHAAGELGLLGTPAFMFQEGDDPPIVQKAFHQIAHLTKGAYAHFDVGAARQLAELLRAVAIFASGGLTALEHSRGEGAVKLLGQLRGRSS